MSPMSAGVRVRPSTTSGSRRAPLPALTPPPGGSTTPNAPAKLIDELIAAQQALHESTMREQEVTARLARAEEAAASRANVERMLRDAAKDARAACARHAAERAAAEDELSALKTAHAELQARTGGWTVPIEKAVRAAMQSHANSEMTKLVPRVIGAAAACAVGVVGHDKVSTVLEAMMEACVDVARGAGLGAADLTACFAKASSQKTDEAAAGEWPPASRPAAPAAAEVAEPPLSLKETCAALSDLLNAGVPGAADDDSCAPLLHEFLASEKETTYQMLTCNHTPDLAAKLPRMAACHAARTPTYFASVGSTTTQFCA